VCFAVAKSAVGRPARYMERIKRILRIKVKSKETATAVPQLERAMLPKVETRIKRGDH